MQIYANEILPQIGTASHRPIVISDNVIVYNSGSCSCLFFLRFFSLKSDLFSSDGCMNVSIFTIVFPLKRAKNKRPGYSVAIMSDHKSTA